MQSSRLVLKKDREKPVRQKHHWIYSGAVHQAPNASSGLVPVFSFEGKKLGMATWLGGESIVAHMITFGEEGLEEGVRARIRNAKAMRERWLDPEKTNSYRLIHAEGDGLPGLIVDSYAGVFVMQIANAALASIRDSIIQWLVEEARPRAIYEKSTSVLRSREGVPKLKCHCWGEELEIVEILENGLRYQIDIVKGQKTGWFLDQRDLRQHIQNLARGKKVLDLFAYGGGFAVSALSGGALEVTSVDVSHLCEGWAKNNVSINHLPQERYQFICADVPAFLEKSDLYYDLVVLDPPAFAKKRKDIPQASRAYRELNYHVMKKMPAGSLLLTCSCSYFIDPEALQHLLFCAARAANRSVRIVGRYRNGLDHPTNLAHPEGEYLKSFLLYIE